MEHEKVLYSICDDFIKSSRLIKYDYDEENPAVHVQRKTLIASINSFFIDYTKRYKENPDAHIILRWFYTQKMFDTSNRDPLLPYSTTLNEGLKYELEKYRVPIEDIVELQGIISNMIINYKRLEKWINIKIELVQKNDDYTISRGNTKFKISGSTFERLNELYNGDNRKFLERTFNLLCRYYSLSSPGYHAAIPVRLFSILKKELGVTHEIYASPFNCNMEVKSYTSAYPDVDKYFSSKGNFYEKRDELFLNGGSFEANPPFLEEHMITFSMLITEELKRNVPLSFVVIYPAWTDSVSLDILINSPFNRLDKKVLVFNERDHYYEQSSQYSLKNGDIKVSGSKSALFILQNEEGKKKYMLSEDLINRIIQEFTIGHL